MDGKDWRTRTLEERKERLAQLLAKAPVGIQYTEHLEGDGAAIFAPCLQAWRGRHRLEAPRASVPIRAEQGLAQDQEPGGAWRAAISGGAMNDPPRRSADDDQFPLR